jgi:hypothetical protein
VKQGGYKDVRVNHDAQRAVSARNAPGAPPRTDVGFLAETADVGRAQRSLPTQINSGAPAGATPTVRNTGGVHVSSSRSSEFPQGFVVCLRGSHRCTEL